MANDVKVIELTADVKNPRPDRRSKDWNKLPVFKKGERFTVHQSRDGWQYLYSATQPYRAEPDTGEVAKAILANARLP